MNLDKLISEEINKYINESFFEANKKDSSSEKHNTLKSKKRDNKLNKVEQSIEKAHRRDGENVSRSDEEILRRLFATDYLNEAAIAREIYPDHTPEGAQSQLRKKLVGETNDNGTEYHLREREAAAIRQIINKIKSAIG